MYKFILVILCCGTLLSAQERSVDEWIAHVQKETQEQIADWAAHPERELILLGGSLCSKNHPGKNGHVKEYPKRHQEAIAAFKAFMASRGEELLQSWLAGEQLSAEDAVYERLFYALKMSMHAKQHRDSKKRLYVPPLSQEHIQAAEKELKQLTKQGQALMMKGFETHVLSNEDIDVLRRFHIAIGTRCVGGTPYMPFRMGLTTVEKNTAILGIPASDVGVAPLSSVLARSTYSDMPDWDFPQLIPMRSDGILELLHCIRAFDSDGKKVVPSAWQQAQPELRTLSEIRGEKPLLIIAADATDCFLPFAFSELEVLYQAYKDRVEFLFVNTTIHDNHMSPQEYFDRVPNGLKAYVGHPFTQEERARTAKNLYMRYPHVTVPCAVDDAGSTFEGLYGSQGGSAALRLIDRTGNLADSCWTPFCGTIWANEVELSIRRLLANDGCHDPAWAERVMIPRKGKIQKGAVASPMLVRHSFDLRERVVLTLKSAVITAVSPESIQVKVRTKKESVTHTLVLSAHTRLQTGDGQLLSAADLTVGKKVSVDYWADQRFGKPVAKHLTKVDHTRLCGTGFIQVGDTRFEIESKGGNYGYRGWQQNYITTGDSDAEFAVRRIVVFGNPARPAPVWLCGTIESIDTQHRTLTVRQKVAAPNELLGFQYNRLAEGKAVLTDNIISRQKAVAHWMERSGDALLRTIRIDDGVEIFHNGRFDGTIADIHVGDAIGVEYITHQEYEDLINPEKIRISTVVLEKN